MRAEVTRRIRFEAAHRLPDHKGQCANVHGHSWQAWITIEGQVEPDGMVVDMSHIAAHFRDEIEQLVDHSVLNEVLPQRFQPPSTEHVAAWLLHEFANAGFPVVKVTVQETENQTATVHA